MARPLRIEFAGALYHVMSRWNERKLIVRDDADREKRLDCLDEEKGTSLILLRLPRPAGTAESELEAHPVAGRPGRPVSN